ncbi:unnamed protein product [Ectocarpus sp. 8 AP-2014]
MHAKQARCPRLVDDACMYRSGKKVLWMSIDGTSQSLFLGTSRKGAHFCCGIHGGVHRRSLSCCAADYCMYVREHTTRSRCLTLVVPMSKFSWYVQKSVQNRVFSIGFRCASLAYDAYI